VLLAGVIDLGLESCALGALPGGETACFLITGRRVLHCEPCSALLFEGFVCVLVVRWVVGFG